MSITFAEGFDSIWYWYPYSRSTKTDEVHAPKLCTMTNVTVENGELDGFKFC